jgi:hypothetical protein
MTPNRLVSNDHVAGDISLPTLFYCTVFKGQTRAASRSPPAASIGRREIIDFVEPQLSGTQFSMKNLLAGTRNRGPERRVGAPSQRRRQADHRPRLGEHGQRCSAGHGDRGRPQQRPPGRPPRRRGPGAGRLPRAIPVRLGGLHPPPGSHTLQATLVRIDGTTIRSSQVGRVRTDLPEPAGWLDESVADAVRPRWSPSVVMGQAAGLRTGGPWQLDQRDDDAGGSWG